MFFYIFFTVKEFLQCHFVLENVKQMKQMREIPLWLRVN